jgi:endogenous inhibitor of DNA gyrase (YacG/DUF329 family)
VSPAPRCASCDREATQAWFPFCSERCKLADLGKWINEEYRIPVADEPGSRNDPSDDE